MSGRVVVVGGGLAGSEAAWQAARLGAEVKLYEMRPVRSTPAHHTGRLAELVCSNSLGGTEVETPAGLLKEEMRRLGSCIIAAAGEAAVPAGGALAVDREIFAEAVTRAVAAHPRIEVIREEVTRIPSEGPVILATGPLTSEALAEDIKRLTGGDDLYFYDAAAPIVTRESVDEEAAFWASRHGKGSADYLNCPLDKETYYEFWEALRSAERHEGHIEEELVFFEGCVPVEELAERGPQTLLFGPMRPVGLIDPRTGKRPFAVVQLRKENAAGSLLNLVGFQTRLRWGEQRRVLQMVPALREAEIVRYGVIHRNTFVNSPRVLLPTYQSKARPDLFLAGQMTGVEGYVESAAAGLLAGINAARLALGREPASLPVETMMGALAGYITSADPEHFQPMNANYGLLPPLPERVRDKRERKRRMAERALQAIEAWKEAQGLELEPVHPAGG